MIGVKHPVYAIVEIYTYSGAGCCDFSAPVLGHLTFQQKIRGVN